MNGRNVFPAVVVAAALLLGLAALAPAQDDMAALQQRFQARYPNLLALKDAGKVGENWQGYLEPVKEEYLKEEGVKKILDEENADRAVLYKSIAAQNGITPEVVGERNFLRAFSQAKPGHWFKYKDAGWKRKE